MSHSEECANICELCGKYISTLDEVICIDCYEKSKVAELEVIVNQLVQENANLISEHGLLALSPLVGVIAKTYRNRVDIDKATKLLRDKIENRNNNL